MIIASCVKNEEFEVLSGSFDFTVKATMPELEELQTKASTSVVVRLNWKEGDKLSVINLTTGKALGGDLVAKSTGVTTDFSGTLVGTVSSSDNLLFLYPSQSFATEEPFGEIDIDFSNQSGKSGVDVCVYAIGRLGNVNVSGVSAAFKFLMSYVEMNLSDLEESGTISSVKVENMGAGITLASNSTKDDILATENNGTITLTPSAKINASGSCAVFLSTFASSAPSSERKVIVNTSNATVAADWSAAALKAGKFYNTILTGFEEYEDPEDPEDPVPGTPIAYKVDGVVLGQSIPVIGDWDNDPETENTYLHWAPVNCGYEAVGTIGSKDDHRLGKLYQWGYGDRGFSRDNARSFFADESTNGLLTTFSPSSNTWNEGQGPCPHGWRMPTEGELTVLITGKNGSYGWVTSGAYGEESGYKGAEFFGGNEDMTLGAGVFLPATYYYQSYETNTSLNKIRYWSSSFDTEANRPMHLYSGSSIVPVVSSISHSYAYPVRCVCDSPSTPPSAHKATLDPTVTISINNGWTANSADISVTILSDGGAPVFDRGVLYGTSESNIANIAACSTGGTGSYQVTLTSLTGSTRYYVKAYATNSEGTTYSQVFTFDTEEIGNGFNWNVVSHSAVQPLNAHYSGQWFVSDGVIYCDGGRTILTVDNESHTMTTSVNISNWYRDWNIFGNLWTAPDGNVYGSLSGDDDPERSSYFTVYRFVNGNWEAVGGTYGDWEHIPGSGMWKTNNYVYDRDGSTFLRASNGYSFGTVTISNTPTYFSGSCVWNSASGTAYYSSGSSHYCFNESGLNWYQLTASGWPAITAQDVFVIGSFTYWVSGGDCYMFNESSKTWTRIDNDFRKGLYGRYVWSYGGRYYYSDGTINKELKQGGQSFTTVSSLCFPSSIDNYDGCSHNIPICNIDGNMIWGQYLKTPGTCVWNRLSTYSNSIVTFEISMSAQYYYMEEYYDDEEYTTTYYMYPIDPSSGLHSSDYQCYGEGTTFYYAQSLWKDRNGVVHYSDDKRVFTDASGRCYYCCDSKGNTSYVRATHYRIYDETNGWSALIPLNVPDDVYLDCRFFWSDGEGNIYYTRGYTQYQLVPKD